MSPMDKCVYTYVCQYKHIQRERFLYFLPDVSFRQLQPYVAKVVSAFSGYIACILKG